MTLLEIMIVVSVIGVLAALAAVAIMKVVERSRISQAEQELERLAAAIEQLAWDTGKWPGGLARTTQDREVTDLSKPDAGLITANSAFGSKWKGPYIDFIPIDPWGTKYFFDSDYYVDGNMGNTSPSNLIVVVGSYGPNRGGAYDRDNMYVEVRRR
jgi:general secretion pathway protein G